MHLDLVYTVRFEWKNEYVVGGEKNNKSIKCNNGNMLLSSYDVHIDKLTAGSLKCA